MSQHSPDWVSQRTTAARIQADRLAARQSAAHDKAEAIISSYLPRLRASGPPPEPLVVKGYGGKGAARSNVTGWYLRNDRAAGLGVDGKFYVLTAPLSARDRLRGVRLTPTRPPLILGEGGKDGDSVDLADALTRLLAQQPR